MKRKENYDLHSHCALCSIATGSIHYIWQLALLPFPVIISTVAVIPACFFFFARFCFYCGEILIPFLSLPLCGTFQLQPKLTWQRSLSHKMFTLEEIWRAQRCLNPSAVCIYRAHQHSRWHDAGISLLLALC